MHLDEEQVQRLLHGELSRKAEVSARDHIATCLECGHRAADAEREEDEVHGLLRAVDDPTPSIDADAIAAATPARHFALSRLAAGLLLALGVAGAAYALPGSPLPRWVRAAVEWIGGGAHRPPPAPAPERAPDRRVAGIAVPPGQNLIIRFESAQRAGQVRVSMGDGAEVVVRAPIGAATFTSEVDRLVIDNRGASDFEIQIPRSAPRVEIQASGSLIFLERGGRVIVGGAADTSGFFVLRLAPAGH